MSPREYRLGQRQTAVDETRGAIIAAARKLLAGKQGVAAFTIDAIAKEAGVARMTVYHQFGSKRGLLEALFDDLGARGLLPHLPAAFANPAPEEALTQVIAAFGRFWDSDRLVLRRIRSLAGLETDFEEAVRARDERRRCGLRGLLGRLAPRPGLQSPEEIDRTVELLLTLTSFETFDSLAGTARTPREVIPEVQQLVRTLLRLDSPSGRAR